MAKSLRYTVLPVGQGTGTFLQVFDGSEVVEATLIDLGSRGWQKAQTGAPSAKFVVEQLQAMAAPKLRAVFLSHADSDHVDLLRGVLKEFNKPTGPVTKPSAKVLRVGDVWFGGDEEDYDKKRGKGPLAELKSYGATVHILGAEESGLRDPAPLLPPTQGVEYWLVVANVTAPKSGSKSQKTVRPDSFLRNVVSLVLAVKYGNPNPKCMIAPGDAFGLTLAQCNEYLSGNRVVVPPVLTLALPHHGSDSSYDVKGVQRDGGESADRLGARVVREFVQRLQPESITASAGEAARYRHPAGRTIADFARSAKTGMFTDGTLSKGDKGEHFFTAHYPIRALKPAARGGTEWPPSEGWYTGQTKWNVFTTDYFRGDTKKLAPPEVSFRPAGDPQVGPSAPGPPYGSGATVPPRAAGWAFEIAEDGTEKPMKRVVDRWFTTPAQIAALEAVHGPLPPERFVFVPSAPAAEPSAEAEPAPPPAVVREALPPSRPSPPGLRRLRQLP